MQYTIPRLEYMKDHEGNITSIFLAVSVSDGVNSTTYEHWLSGEEMTAVLADEANLDPILKTSFAEAELKMENEIATRPQPTEFPLRVGTKRVDLQKTIKEADIVVEKEAILEARAIEAQPIDIEPLPIEKPVEPTPVEVAPVDEMPLPVDKIITP